MAFTIENIQFIQNGETLNAEVFNRPYIRFVENLEAFEASIETGSIFSFEQLNVSNINSGTLPHIRFPYATENEVGLVEKATDEEVEAYSGNEKFVSSQQMVSLLNSISGSRSISLQGNAVIAAGASENFTITDYNVFSTYSATFDKGTATITDDVINVAVDSGETGIGELIVSMDGFEKVFNIAVGVSTIAIPVIEYPVEGNDDIPVTPTIQASTFQAIPAGSDTHTSTDWQISTNSSFSNIVSQSMADTVNLTSWTVSGSLTVGSTYYVRVRYNGASNSSEWSTVIEFIVANRPSKPTFVSSTEEDSQTPTFKFSAFSSPVSETHDATDWEIRLASNDSLVWSRYGEGTYLTEITIPIGALEESTNYKIRVRYYGSILGYSDWSDFYSFTSEDSFFDFVPSSAGLPYGGGHYAGNISYGGNTYALILAPRTQGGSTQAPFHSSGTTAAITDDYDGATNTAELVDDSVDAALFCDGLSINGYNDWYMPSLYEMEIIYYHLKPTNDDNVTNVGTNPYAVPPRASNYTASEPSIASSGLFQRDGDESLIIGPQDDRYWTSTLSGNSMAQRMRTLFGSYIATSFSSNYNIRAVRKIQIS